MLSRLQAVCSHTTLTHPAEPCLRHRSDPSQTLDFVNEANLDSLVLGIFAEGSFPVRWEKPSATVHR